ncbi:hypothetical protein QR680_009739 [Steinernema hermaphroditum]|uniref:Uncharacterized protein n=1 Tax=Steinernema hermaphroditum TaxID=289476 RepID=A0AA39IMS6_9BILA|nr:hypothetical protein QR680_009739 [Steinernema hermaphroditum]
MLAARGVSLGLGKINLSDLHNFPGGDRAAIGRTRRSKDVAVKPKLRVKKHVDKKVGLYHKILLANAADRRHFV